VDALVRHANNRNVSINLRDIFPFPYERHDAEAWLKQVRRWTRKRHLQLRQPKS